MAQAKNSRSAPPKIAGIGNGSSNDGQDTRHERISRAAYYNAELRGFAEGQELEDWLAAERLIDGEDSSQQTADGADKVRSSNATDSADEKIEPHSIPV